MSEISTVEAVIISGSRRGQIVNVDLEQQEVLSEEELVLLRDAMSKLDAELVRTVEAARGLNQSLREATSELRSESSHANRVGSSPGNRLPDPSRQ